MTKYLTFLFVVLLSQQVFAETFEVKVSKRPKATIVSKIDNTTSYSLVFNPTWIEATDNTNNRSGLLIRTQDCPIEPGDPCSFCGGSQELASILTFSELLSDGSYSFVDSNSVLFGPADATDSWGTEDPRMLYNHQDKQYYMFYTAYNGQDIYMSLATSKNPIGSANEAPIWERHGAVFPDFPSSKSGALMIRDSGPHYLIWGDSDIRIAASYDPMVWPSDGGSLFLQTREDKFDSKLVESGPPPLLLSNGDYIFFYNSATVGWPDEPGIVLACLLVCTCNHITPICSFCDIGSAYHPGYVILDGKDPTVIKQRSDEPLLTPLFASERGVEPYTCNVPNVIFLEAARPIGVDTFEVYFGAADAALGSAVIEVLIK